MLSNGGVKAHGHTKLHDAPPQNRLQIGSFVTATTTPVVLGQRFPHPKPNTPIGAQVLFNFGAEQSSGDTRQREGLVCDWSNHHFDSGEHRCINVEHKQPLSHAYKVGPPWHSQRNINADCRGHDFDRPRQLPHTRLTLTLLIQLVCVPVEEFSVKGRFVKKGSVISSGNAHL